MGTMAIYPGSFDPITLGHIDIAHRAAAIFDRVIVAVYDTPAKSLIFTTDERVAMARRGLGETRNVEIRPFTGLLVSFAREVGAKVIVRGLRAVSDFEMEMQMALMNHKLAPDVEEVYLMASLRYSFLSASLIKDVVKLGGPAEGLVPDFVAEALRQKFAGSDDAVAVPRWLSG